MFKKLLDAFVEVTPDATAEAAAPQAAASTKPVAAPSSTPAPASSMPPPLTSVSGAFNPEMQKDLMAAVQAANLEGYDYLELLEAMKNMASLPIPDEQKIMAAFATIANLTTKEKLVGSVDHYLQVVDASEAKFLDAAAKKEQTQVVAREDEIKSLDKEVQTLGQQITQITTRINEIQTKKAALATEKEAQRSKIQAAKSSFQVTAKVVRDQLLNDKQRIGAALGVNTSAKGA